MKLGTRYLSQSAAGTRLQVTDTDITSVGSLSLAFQRLACRPFPDF